MHSHQVERFTKFDPVGMKKRLREYLQAFLIISVTFALMEGIARVSYPYVTPKEGRKAVSFLLGETMAEGVRTAKHPYMLYINTPGWQQNGIAQHNSLGHRGPDVSPEPGPGVLRILAMGGSTTYAPFVSRPEMAWPARLEQILTDRLGRPVEVINAGLPYGLSSELLAHWVFRDRFLKPHLVILHTGGNDAATMLVESYKPDYSHFRGWEVTPLGPRPGESLVMKSHLIRVAYAWWLSGPGVANLAAEPREFGTLTEKAAVENAQRNEPIGFARNMDFLIRNIVADGAIPILFPYYVPQKEIFSIVESKYAYAEKFYEGIKIGVKKNTEVMRGLARKYGTPIISLPDGFIPLTCFVDHAHLNEEGETIKGTFVADEIIALIEQGKLDLTRL